MALTAHDSNVADELKKRLLSMDREHKIYRVILYGSRARGTAQTDSDYDILIVEKDPVSKRDEMHRFRKEMRSFLYGLDIRVIGQQEFEETRKIIGGLAYPADKYGHVLYENP